MKHIASLALAAALFPCAVSAQSTADKFPYPGESAPAPQPAKPLLVPKGTLQADPHDAEVKIDDPPCFSPSDKDGYTYKAKPGPHQNELMQEYFWNVRKSIYDHWLINMPRMASRPWLKKGITGVKITIEPDGTIDTPFVTLSANHDGFDEHAVKSFQEMSPLPPPPTGTQVVRACFFFYYNMMPPQPAKQKPHYDDWLDKPAAAPK